MTEPPAPGLTLVHEHGRALHIGHRGQPLLRYVYEPWDGRLESPRPYFHPLHTLGGDLVSLFRPHDHVWHKGLAWSLPNVGTANFWGGTTYRRGRGYAQLANNGAMRHQAFDAVESAVDRVGAAHRLHWITEQGETWFHETRGFTVTAEPDRGSWTLAFATRFANVTPRPVPIGSPTTEGRENAGYGGLFWRGPRSFTGCAVFGPEGAGGDELMGTYGPWLGVTGVHDGHGRASTLVFADAPDNPGHPVQWFARSGMYACVCPAPFFSAEVAVAPGKALDLRYAVVVADGDRSRAGGALARTGLAALPGLDALVGERKGPPLERKTGQRP